MEELSILYEDDWLLVVNKTRLIRVQKDASGEANLEDELASYLKTKAAEAGRTIEPFVGLVHRLDQPATGLVLFAKDPETLAALNELLKVRAVDKLYWAVTDKAPPATEGRLDHWLLFERWKGNKSFASEKEKKGTKRALLDYRVVGKSEKYFFLEIKLITGRHHQIRAQLAAVGCRIKGDLKYGAKRSNPGGGIHLHARSLAFKHPRSGKKVEVTAPPPEDALWKAFEAVAGDAGKK